LVALPTLSTSSLSTGTPIAHATCCPEGKSILKPRSRFRTANAWGPSLATDKGKLPSGLTSDVSIL
jgi:hypothetical protein